jgi:hypothetical protein
VGYEGVNISDSSSDKDNHDNNNPDINAYFANNAPNDIYTLFTQFLTFCGLINGQITTEILNNAAILHAVTGIDPYKEEAKEPTHLFTFYSRYDEEVFQGILPDTGAAGKFIKGLLQFKALQKQFPELTINAETAGQHKIYFGDGPEKRSHGAITVNLPFGPVNFAIMPTNTFFLLCLADMNRLNVYLNNLENMLVHNGKNYPVVRKWGYSWLLLDDQEPAIAHSHLTEDELRQLYRKFEHPAAKRLHNILLRAGYNDVKKSIVAKITKFCH